MSIRQSLRHALAVALFFAGIASAPARPPNIVLLLADDLGWTSLGCYGNPLHETPNLNRMAREGLRFTDAYAACTVCSPTRASLMTGKYPARLHLTDFIAGQNRPFEKLTIPAWTKYLPTEEDTLAEQLRRAGYRTAHVGKWHLSNTAPVRGHDNAEFLPTGQGFETSTDAPKGTKGYFLPPDFPRPDGTRGGYLTDHLTDEALKVIERHRAEPFFLYLAYHTPHTPIQGRAELITHYEEKLRQHPEIQIRNATYAAMIHSLDQSVGRVIDKVDQLGLAKDTLIVFISDNGGLTQRYGKIDNIADNTPLRRGKGSAYEGGVRVPMIARRPGHVPAASESSTPVSTIDFLPTLLAAAGLEPAAPIDGVSLLPVLLDPSVTRPTRDLFWHYPHYHAGGDAPYSAIRNGDWRLIDFHDDTPDALYNLGTDIGESVNRLESDAAIAKDLRSRLDHWRKQIGAQMPKPNPGYDPDKVDSVAKKQKR
jgi:arylsulfatase A